MSTHGLSNIFKTEKFGFKVMWLISFLISSSGCSYFIINTISDYLKYDVVSNINVVYEHPAQFPAVTICSRDSYKFQNFTEIRYCIFNFDDACLYNPEDYFEQYDDPHYGICYRFNTGKNASGHRIPVLNSTYSGKENGLIVDI